jgi:mannose-6-phosphate isomerase-like protein (cupin superfamily)
MIEGKVWGTTEPLIVNSSLEVHRITVIKGGYCSLHKHQSKYNAFYVMKGKLIVEIHKKDYELVDKTVLIPNEFTVVSPGEYHKFISSSATTALEIYWSELNHNDIIRKDVGGLLNYL